MSRAYSQMELIQMVRLPATTVKRWLTYYSLFMPTVRKGDIMMYRYEAIPLLKRIEALRKERYHLGTIVRILIEEGFPVYRENDADEGKPYPQEPAEVQLKENINLELAQSLEKLSQQIQELAGLLQRYGAEA